MIVEVKIFSALRKNLPFSNRRLEGDRWDLPGGARVADVLALLNLSGEEDLIFLVNGRNADRDRVLDEGDVLHIFPPIIGG